MDYNSIVFREFTHESFERIERYEQEEAEPIGPKRMPNKELAVGQRLPRILQNKFPVELIGKPIEEIDCYYRTEYVFVVINRNKTIFRFSSTPACFIFSPFNCLRRLAIRILTHSLFNTLVMLTIIANAILDLTVNQHAAASFAITFGMALYTFSVLPHHVSSKTVNNETYELQ